MPGEIQFMQALHDDDVDATSQALTYMRSRVADGIAEFYRLQAEALGRKSGGLSSLSVRDDGKAARA